jgi:small subunit ribosomal protein S1
MKLHHSSDPILQFLADYSNEMLVRAFLDTFGDRRNAELRRLRVRMQGLEAENRALRTGLLPLSADTASGDDVAMAEGTVLTGQVVAIDHLYAVIRLGDGVEHMISNGEFMEDDILPIQVGDYVNLVVTVAPEGVALSHLELKRMQRWVELVQAFDGGDSIQVQLQMPVNAGYNASYRGIPVLIPYSHIDLAPGKHVELLLGTMIDVKVLELDRSSNSVVASRKQVLEQVRERFLAGLNPGDSVDGVVKNVRDFGAFVDLGGTVGLLHNTQMGPLAGTLEVGAAIKARVLKIDREQMKVSLTARPPAPDAWAQVQAQVTVGSRVEGKIRNMTEAGVFVEILRRVNGLIYQSDFKSAYPDPATAPKVGDTVSVTIRSLDNERKRIRLRIVRPSGARR